MADAPLVPDPPPRRTGKPDQDISAYSIWAHSFYEKALKYFESTADARAPGTVDPGTLPDPATSSIPVAQETANDAFILATAAQAEAEAARPLVGSGTISDPATTFVHTFDEAEADTDYKVVVAPSGFTGSPAAASRTVIRVTKTTANFTVTIEAAPGASASVTFDWMVQRNGD